MNRLGAEIAELGVEDRLGVTGLGLGAVWTLGMISGDLRTELGVEDRLGVTGLGLGAVWTLGMISGGLRTSATCPPGWSILGNGICWMVKMFPLSHPFIYTLRPQVRPVAHLSSGYRTVILSGLQELVWQGLGGESRVNEMKVSVCSLSSYS